MKKRILITAIIVCLCILCTGCLFKETAKGENVKIEYTGTADVSFYPVCPSCDHISSLRSANISDGEYKEGTHICENCYEVYTISIDRR